MKAMRLHAAIIALGLAPAAAGRSRIARQVEFTDFANSPAGARTYPAQVARASDAPIKAFRIPIRAQQSRLLMASPTRAGPSPVRSPGR
jgi:hypothetical protein